MTPDPGTTEATADAEPFSAQLRSATAAHHAGVQRSRFLDDLLGGRLDLAAFRRYTEQLWWVYRALEEPAAALAGDPVAGPFVRPELFRLPELARDLDHLHDGPGWRSAAAPLPATAAYAARIRETAERWPGGYVAHHYTRYLGDLSGGQIVRDRAERSWGLARKGDGVRFYVFAQIPNPAAFKRDYRARLDALPAGAAERQRMAQECSAAYELNAAVLEELAHSPAV